MISGAGEFSRVAGGLVGLVPDRTPPLRRTLRGRLWKPRWTAVGTSGSVWSDEQFVINKGNLDWYWGVRGEQRETILQQIGKLEAS